jgi:hypothetical protein
MGSLKYTVEFNIALTIPLVLIFFFFRLGRGRHMLLATS